MDSGLEAAIYAALIAFGLNILASPLMIPALTRLKIGQNVREDGPQSHLTKRGTPTMGGIIIIISFAAASMFFIYGNLDGLMLVFVTIGFGLIGFFDDYIKVVKRRSLGLRAYQKIVLQLLITGVFAAYLYSQRNGFFGADFTAVIVPFTAGATLEMGYLYLPFIFLVMIGTVNGVNLTDGLDGLATGVTLLVAVFYVLMAWAAGSGTLPIAGAAAGSLLAFLLFNAYPAKIFMGDTGALALGGFIAALALMLKLPLFLPIVGIIYVLESLSVIIQVAYFKRTGRRFFKMAPLHHAFEVSGWAETRIVTLFYIITAIACLISFLGARYVF